jgi:WhiB family transcriptional regulator, redox-sensing transcriptional regulator
MHLVNQTMTDRVPEDDPLVWMDRGACRDSDPAVFFPARGEDTTTAKAICMTCPVLTTCQRFGMTQRHGVWGGLSERERRRLRRLRRPR